jgi:hypothetical protein
MLVVVNTNRGGHTIIGFYFAKALLAAGYALTMLTIRDERSDKKKKRQRRDRFDGFTVGGNRFMLMFLMDRRGRKSMQELTSVRAKMVWGEPASGHRCGGRRNVLRHHARQQMQGPRHREVCSIASCLYFLT